VTKKVVGVFVRFSCAASPQDNPYDLLISDLSFKQIIVAVDSLAVTNLLKLSKKVQPHIKTIVFSIEDKSYRIKSLFNNLGINAYVSKEIASQSYRMCSGDYL
jgi:DNA-binding NarL/FixJ family response regulator